MILQRFLCGAAVLLSLTSCNGIFGWIYDNDLATTKSETAVSDVGFSNIDVTDFTQWTYLNFHTRTIETGEIDSDGNFTDPQDWDIAIHRWDARTNGGAALETGFTSLDALTASEAMPEGEFVNDEWTEEQIIIDMSRMMSGIFGYASSWYNRELSKWMNVNIDIMPPIYTMSGKVYLVKLNDGTLVALKLTNYTDAAGNKGYITIDYVYPFEI